MSFQVRVQTERFDLNAECEKLLSDEHAAGAIATFLGVVRSEGESDTTYFLELEHYPEMTEKVIAQILDIAKERFGLLGATVIHRVGKLAVGEQIVMVAVTSAHRKAAFDGCEFIMDYLKTQAPFWKKENSPTGSRWVDAKESDDRELASWGVVSDNAQ